MKESINVCNVSVFKGNQMWEHSEKRIIDAERKSNGDNEKFVKLMLTRLKKIQNEQKIYYAIAVLKERNHQDVVDIYEGKVIMDKILDLER